MSLEAIDFSLRSQLEYAVSVLALRARKQRVELLCDVSPDVPDQLVGDPGRLFQIFANLIGERLPRVMWVLVRMRKGVLRKGQGCEDLMVARSLRLVTMRLERSQVMSFCNF
jgi:hypothetical protein